MPPPPKRMLPCCHEVAAAVALTCPATARQPSATAKATSPAAERQLGVCCGMVELALRQEIVRQRRGAVEVCEGASTVVGARGGGLRAQSDDP